MNNDLLDEIKSKWNIPYALPMSVPWGKDDVAWLVGEVERLRAEAKRADEEATELANSDLATTEQVVRALRAEHDAEIKRLRGALYTVMGACDAECSACGAYYVAKRALDGMEMP